MRRGSPGRQSKGEAHWVGTMGEGAVAPREAEGQSLRLIVDIKERMHKRV